MGLVGDFFATTVLKYKVEADEAVKDLKNLSKEQQKAAKAAAEALKEEGKAAETKGQQYAKAAAIVVGSYAVIKKGLEATAMESRLRLGSVGVDIDNLSDAAGGLKTRWELMTIAQAGSQGAFKMTTQQIALVIEGMRALEKKGFDAIEVQDQLTESLKKGKLEGLDKFGLSAKSTGSVTGDLASLMKQLAGAANDVGGNFDKAGDSIVRNSARMVDGLHTVQVAIGDLVNAAVGLAESAGEGLARAIFGPIPGTASAADPNRYSSQFQTARGGQIRTGSSGGQSLFVGPSDADRAASARLDSFRTMIRNFRGSRRQLDAEASTLPAGWRSIDPALARRFDYLMSTLPDTGGLSASFVIKRIDPPAAPPRPRGGGGGARSPEDPVDIARGRTFEMDIEGPTRHYEAVMAVREEAERLKAVSSAADRALAEQRQGEEKSFLASVFGPIDEFDLYTEALTSLGQTTQSVAGQIYDAWASGAELTTKALRKMFANEIAAAGKKLLVYGISAELTGAIKLATGNPAGALEMAAGAAAIAGSVAIGGIARSLGGPSSGPTASTGARGTNQDHRGNPTSGWHGSGFGDRVLVLSGIHDDESPAYRGRRARDVMARAQGYPPPQGTGRA